MDKKVKDIVNLLSYCGPDINDLISQAIYEEKEYVIEYKNDLTILRTHSILPYDLRITDVFTFNAERQLIKQVLVLGDKENVIFDKFIEANSLISEFIKKCEAS